MLIGFSNNHLHTGAVKAVLTRDGLPIDLLACHAHTVIYKNTPESNSHQTPRCPLRRFLETYQKAAPIWLPYCPEPNLAFCLSTAGCSHYHRTPSLPPRRQSQGNHLIVEGTDNGHLHTGRSGGEPVVVKKETQLANLARSNGWGLQDSGDEGECPKTRL